MFRVAVYGSILMPFSAFVTLSDGLDSFHFCCWMAPQFKKKIGKKIAKNRRKSLCAPLRIDGRNITI